VTYLDRCPNGVVFPFTISLLDAGYSQAPVYKQVIDLQLERLSFSKTSGSDTELSSIG